MIKQPIHYVGRVATWCLALAIAAGAWLGTAPAARAALPPPSVVDLPDDPESVGSVAPTIANVDDLLQATQKRIDQARQAFRPVPMAEIERLTGEADRVLRDLQLQPGLPAYQDLLQAARTKLLQAQVRLMPSRPVEFRGVFLDGDAIPPTTDGIAALLRKLKAAGFNAVFPEIFRRGFTMYRSRITEMDPSFVRSGFDVLDTLVKEAHKQGLEVYPWIWTFRVQSPSLNLGNPILDRLPALTAVPLKRNGNGSELQDEANPDENLSFISPASPEWRELLTSMLAEVVRSYPIDGYVLDYIRYGNNKTEDQLSFTNFQLDYFRRTGNFPPKQFEPGSEVAVQWHSWREEQVHLMVQELTRKLVKERDGLSLGAAVFRSEIHSRMTKMQDWRHWSDNNWLDFISPMMYTDGVDQLDTWLDWETDLGKRQDMLYPVLSGHPLHRFADLFNLVGLLQERNIPGVSVFAIRQLNDDLLQNLGQGPFRTPAVPPHHNVPRAVQQQMRATAAWLRQVLIQAPATEVSVIPAASALPAATAARIEPGAPSAVPPSASPLPVASPPAAPPAYLADLQSLQGELSNAADQLLGPGGRTVAPDPATMHVGLLQVRAHADRLAAALPPALASELKQQLDYAAQLVRIYQWHHRPDLSYVPPSRPPVKVLPEALPLPSAAVIPASPPPTIDGSLGDPSWARAQTLSQFFWNTGSARPQVNTRVRLTYDREYLYVGFDNEEPRMERVRARTRGNNSERILQEDDTVEVFLSPGNRPNAYYHFVLNLNNAQFSRAPFDSAWSAEWQSAVRTSEKGWTAELRIPFSTLRVGAPERGGRWRANFCRRRWQEVNSYQCWSFTFGGVHRADRFGTLNFKPLPQAAPPPEIEPDANPENPGGMLRLHAARHAPTHAARHPRRAFRLARRLN